MVNETTREVIDAVYRDKFIERIGELQAELESLGVKRERFDFEKMSLDDIRELGTAVSEQLKQRKKWLGVE